MSHIVKMIILNKKYTENTERVRLVSRLWKRFLSLISRLVLSKSIVCRNRDRMSKKDEKMPYLH